MAQDPTLGLRKKIIVQLKATEALLELVPEASIYGERTPADKQWPFIRYGVSDTRPRKGQCWDGADVDIAIHCFSKSPFTDEAGSINAAIAAALDGATIDLGGARAHIAWKGSTVLPDPAEADAWHGISRFSATTA